MATREQAVAQAKSWHGLKESDGSFKPIIDIYNSAAKSKITLSSKGKTLRNVQRLNTRVSRKLFRNRVNLIFN